MTLPEAIRVLVAYNAQQDSLSSNLNPLQRGTTTPLSLQFEAVLVYLHELSYSGPNPTRSAIEDSYLLGVSTVVAAVIKVFGLDAAADLAEELGFTSN